MKKIVTSLFFAVLCSIITANAQVRPVTGTVKDDKGRVVASATVKVKGQNSAIVADENGAFKINASTTAVLQVSAVGFKSTEVSAKSAVVNVVLVSDESELENVVVTAQGIRKKSKEIGYAYAKVSTDEINVGRSPQLAQALSGKVSGLAVYNVNNSVDPQVKIVLRGYRSLTGNNEALIVLDGMQTTSTVLSLINPNDIENVTILKGGQAAALYGSAGVNGAMIITTKKGAKGKLKVAFSNATNFEQISFLPQFQDKYGSGSHYATSYGGAGYKTDYLARMADNWRPFENQQFGDAFDGKDRVVGRVAESGDKLILPYAALENARRNSFDMGVSTNNQVSFQGGDENSTFYLSAENQKINGIVPGDKSERTGIRLAATKTYNKLTVGYNASYSQAKYDRTTSDFYYNIMNTAANIPVDRMRNWKTDQFANPNGYYNDYYQNPYFSADNYRTSYQDANISGAIELNYKATSWLNFMERAGIMNNSRIQKSWTGKFIYSDWAKNSAYVPAPWDWANDYDGIDRAGTDILGAVSDYSKTENVLNNEFQAQMNKELGKFSNKLVLGYSTYQRKTKEISLGSSSVVVPDVYNVSNRQGELSGSEYNSTERKFGYYADLTSSFNNYLTLEGIFRYDYSSRFYKSDRELSLYAFPYYGVSLAFQATEAFPQIKSWVLNDAKVRLSYNKNGNDNMTLYGLDLTYPNASGFPFGNTVGLTVGNTLPDNGLKPEFVTSYEAGTELSMFNNRVNLELTAYSSQSKGQVITVKVPNTTGFSNLLINVGETKNWGYEGDLKVQVIRKGALKWDLGLRYSFNDNKVVSLYPGISQFTMSGYSYASTNVEVGKSFPLLKSSGYYYSATGARRVDPTTGYPLQNTAMVDRGSTLAKHMAGFSSKLGYKNWNLSMNLEYRGGNVMYSGIGRDMTFTGSGKWTENRAPHVFENSYYLVNGVETPNTSLNVRESEYSLWVDNYRFIAENFVNKAWFIKLRDVNLSYSLPAALVAKTKIFSGANVSVYGRNLFTIIDSKNFFTDPEFSFTTGNGIGINTSLQTPPVRQFGFNVNFTF